MTPERLLKIAVRPLPWLNAQRWRVYAQTSRSRVVVFVMYLPTEPTLEDANAWFAANSGEAVEFKVEEDLESGERCTTTGVAGVVPPGASLPFPAETIHAPR